MSVDTDPFETIVPNLMDGIAKLLQNDEIKLDAHLIHAWGEGYAIPSDDGNAAIELMAKCEGIFLDPVYTGKAFGGLIKALSNGTISKDETILFMHTGGAGGLFAFEH